MQCFKFCWLKPGIHRIQNFQLATMIRRHGELTSISKNVYIRHGECLSDKSLVKDPLRLVVLLPWLYASQKSIHKYCDFYNRHCLDVLVVQSQLQHFLLPSVGRAEARNLLTLLTSGDFCHYSQILLHGISIGNYLQTLVLRDILASDQQFSSVREKIKGQIFDSPMIGDQNKLVKGILLAQQYNLVFQMLIQSTLRAYFALTKRWTADFHQKCYEDLRTDLLSGPVLLIYCRDDALVDAKEVEKLFTGWQNKPSIQCHVCVWDHSLHASHLMIHPEEYCQRLHRFMQEIHFLPIKSNL